MKKRYLINLPEEKTEELKVWLDKHGLTLSGFLSSIVEEQMDTMKALHVPADVSKMTLGDFARMAGKMMVNLNKSKGARLRK
jgi:predicted DNA-binding protein